MGLRVWIWLLSLSVLWGGSFFFAKVAIGELGPLTVVFARVAWRRWRSTSCLPRRRRACSGATRRGAPTSPWASLNNAAALQLDLLGPDPHRLGPGLDPERHDAALHPARRPFPDGGREDRPAPRSRPCSPAWPAWPCWSVPDVLRRRRDVWGQLACLRRRPFLRLRRRLRPPLPRPGRGAASRPRQARSLRVPC